MATLEPIATVLRRLRCPDLAPVLLAACLLLAIRSLLALALISPWQQPDEPSHVALAELQRSRIELLDGTPDPAREREILASMAEYDWWEHRAIGWEAPLLIPTRFNEAGVAGGRVVVEVTGITDPPGYFRIAGRLLSWLPRLAITHDLYILRGLSMLFGLLMLWAAWLAAREFAGTSAAAVVVLLLALHPQLLTVSTAATPDALTNFLGACFWWQAAVAVRRAPTYRRLILVWAIAIAAAAVDRMGVPLIAVALVVSIVALWSRVALAPQTIVRTLGAGVLAAGVVGTVVWVFNAFGETYGLRRVFSVLVPVEGVMTMGHFTRFNAQLHRSWWFSLGWGRYPTPDWWAAVTVVLSLAATAGILRYLIGTAHTEEPRSRTLTALAVAGIAIQLFAVYWVYFRLGNGAQGRYLFPMVVPSMVLLWRGVEAWTPRHVRWHAAAALVLIVGLLDVAVWGLVAIPAYYRSF